MKIMLIFTWLKFKRWLLSLLVRVGLKKTIDWNAELMKLLGIANEVVDLATDLPRAPKRSRRQRRK
jgi:hypothetical protein